MASTQSLSDSFLSLRKALFNQLPQGLGFSKHHELKPALEQVAKLGPGYAARSSSGSVIQTFSLPGRCRHAPPGPLALRYAMDIPMHLILNFITPLRMDTPKIGQLFLEKLWKQWPELSPSHVNSFEPIKHVVSSSAEAIEHWGSTFLWKNRRKRIQGSVWPGAEGESSWVVIKVQNCKDTQVFLSSFKQIAEFLKVDVATFHSIIKEEPAIFGSAKYALQCGFPPVALKRGIPDIPWQILFSATYADKLSLNGSPPSPASSRSLGLLTEVTLSEKPDDDHHIIAASRSKVRNWIGAEHFWDIEH